jgi:tripartite-type tricarboxylate transporter receptor subunit TctC
VRIIVPFTAGGATDVTARALAAYLATALGQPFIVENKAGAAGKIGTEFVARSEDDHLLLMTNPSSHTLPWLIERKPSFDPVRDFHPVAQVASATLFLAVNSKVQAQNLPELLALARRNPGKLSYGSIGNGSAQHLVSELMKQRTGISMVHIPYRGEMPAINDLLAGSIDVFFVASAKRFEAEPRVRLLAVAASERWFNLPQIPTMAEQGLDNFTFDAWNGLVGSRAVPADAVQKLNAAVNAALKTPGVRDALQTLGYQPVGGNPDVLARRISADIKTYRPLIERKLVQLSD